MAIIDRDYLEDFVASPALLNTYSKNSAENVTNAIAAFHDAFKSAAIKRGYTAASIDALTVATAPAFWKLVGAEYALGAMTAGDGSRPSSITDGWKHAHEQLGLLAGGAHTLDDLSLTSRIHYSAPDNEVFDNTDEDSPSYYRDWDL